MAGKKAAAPEPASDTASEAAAPTEEGATGDEGAGAPRFGKKQKIMAAAGAALLLAGGGGAALFMGGGDSKKDAKHEEAGAEEEHAATEEAEAEGEGKDGELPLVDVPPMIVNLRTSGGEARYLKLRFMIEARSATKVDALKTKLPAIIDSFQPFLRELRPEDLSGAAAVYRIKEEMMVRATAAVGTGMVKDILIQDLVQQ